MSRARIPGIHTWAPIADVPRDGRPVWLSVQMGISRHGLECDTALACWAAWAPNGGAWMVADLHDDALKVARLATHWMDHAAGFSER